VRRRLIALACAMAISCATAPTLAASKEPCLSSTKDVTDKKFKPGQIWSYETRPGESASTVTILRIDLKSKIGIVVHVRVDGMPFTRDAMLLSVKRLLKADQPLPTLEGLERWQADCGGVYTISIRDAVDVMEKTLNRP
jgi:hypothetical protein